MAEYRIYYMKSEVFGDFSFGKLPVLSRLSETHVELRTMTADSLDCVYYEQQAHRWAQDYKTTNALLASKGLGHTSMSVGDVVERARRRGVFRCRTDGLHAAASRKKVRQTTDFC